eukprot:SAG22_NODE_273_length_13182_cov_12.693419_11_plen_183_part_00
MGVVSLVLTPLSIYAAGTTLTWARAFDAVQDTAGWVSIVMGVLFLCTAGLLWVSDNNITSLRWFCTVVGLLEVGVGSLVFCPVLCRCCVSEARAGMALFFAYTAMAVLSCVFALLLLGTDSTTAAAGIANSLCRSDKCLDDLARGYGLAAGRHEDARALLAESLADRVNTIGWFLLLNCYCK